MSRAAPTIAELIAFPVYDPVRDGAILSLQPEEFAAANPVVRYIVEALADSCWRDTTHGISFLYLGTGYHSLKRLLRKACDDPEGAVFDAWFQHDADSPVPPLIHLPHPLTGPRFAAETIEGGCIECGGDVPFPDDVCYFCIISKTLALPEGGDAC